MHSNFRIIVTKEADTKLVEMFRDSFEKLLDEGKRKLPDVIIKS